MSVSIDVIPPEGMPDPHERVSSFCNAPGNIMTAVQEVGFDRLDDLNPETAQKALNALIQELDKGDGGKFSDQWSEDADQRWSRGRESQQAWDEIKKYIRPGIEPDYMQSKKTYWGHLMRLRLREDAVRFLMYYRSGYGIRWSP